MAAMRRLTAALGWTAGTVAVLLVVLLLLLMLEASGGHDGYLCEWGYDKDGEGTGVTGCD